MSFQKICFAQTQWRSEAHDYTMNSHHFSHKWHHRTSKVSRPCNWLLPAPFHTQHKLPNTCLCKREGTLGNPSWGHCSGTVTFQFCASSCRTLLSSMAHTLTNSEIRLGWVLVKATDPTLGNVSSHTFSKCSTHTEVVHRYWVRGGGRWGRDKNGRQGGEQ